MTEVWFRNPHAYVKELAEVGGQALVAWDRGMLIKKRIDAVKHAQVYFGVHSDFRLLAVGTQGTAELDKDHDFSNPKAVYPTWEYGEDFRILEEMVSSPISEDPEVVAADVPPDERPRPGQEHRVVVTGLPNAQLSANRPFYRHLMELQEEHPECIIHLHGMYSYRVMFGMGFGAADVEPRTSAANGKVYLPNGKEVAYARTIGQLQWVNLLNMSVTDLKVPRERCIFNIKSARWAGEHFNEDIKFKSRGAVDVDPDSPNTVIPTTAASRTRQNLAVVDGDKIACDTCSLSDSCKFYRDGAVCSLPGAETNALAKAFQSRNSSKIIDGLGTILAAQTDRLQRGMESEEEFGELDAEVTKMMNSIFKNGVTLAKLIDPSLTKPMVQINNGHAGAVAGSNPKEMMAKVVQALQAQGHELQDITQEMVLKYILENSSGPAPETPAIVQGQVS